ncbi:enoyl-CoA hydratase [Paenalcaligenes niemegkensis]|uniref:enoyl-CoA hydratase n=1 Tax=Paenalcaligenes niemegkensis TaxID=2895469 RepID=UPI001EE9960A|nr:enoyl-CoA hydratase [Paenalcaligenes niemegkensis]MCQ9617533.1 enoyl-CoA hydratase [Paenalcaligenes niemegkensis]
MSEPLVNIEILGRVGVLRLNRPKALNALNNDLIAELAQAMRELDSDERIGCIVLTGSEKAFAAGADIGAMKDWAFSDVYGTDYLGGDWESLRRIRKPVIAAVAGFALGGGCELAMQCDIIIAADNARFGQPEIKLGIIPGYGGTQRLPRAVGKAKAMDMILTARMITAEEAEQAGLVSRVVPLEQLFEEALGVAQTIASMSLLSVIMAKESINRAYESPLHEGLLFERRNFHALFSTEDQKEGMSAFVEKRPPNFKHC